jgi:hypothetical protein
LEALGREAEVFDLLDVEAGPHDRLGGVPGRVAAACDRGQMPLRSISCSSRRLGWQRATTCS